MLHTRAVKWMVESPALGRGWRQALAGTHHVAIRCTRVSVVELRRRPQMLGLCCIISIRGVGLT